MSVRSKLKKQYRFVKSLISTGGRKVTSVKKYTGEAFGPINEGLLNKTTLTKKCQDILEDLDSIFRDIPPIEEEFVVYRGVTTKHEFGVLSGFISTSYDYDTALTFASDKKQCCVLIIKVPVGAKVLPVEELSVNPTEGEILLPRSGYFEATNTTYRNGMECFYLNLLLELPKPKPIPTKILSDDQIIQMLIENTTIDDIELLGLHEAMAITADSLKKHIGVIDEKLVKKASETYPK